MYEKPTPRILEQNFKIVLGQIKQKKSGYLFGSLRKKRDKIEKELGIMYNELMGNLN